MNTRTTKRLTLAVAGVLFLGGSGVAVAAADLPIPGAPAEEPSAVAGKDAGESGSNEADLVDSERQQWADEVGQTYLEREGVNSIEALIFPFNKIVGWESPAPGELVIRVDDSTAVSGNPRGGNMANQLQGVAAWVETQIEPFYPELDSVTIATENDEWSVSADYWTDKYTNN